MQGDRTCLRTELSVIRRSRPLRLQGGPDATIEGGSQRALYDVSGRMEGCLRDLWPAFSLSDERRGLTRFSLSLPYCPLSVYRLAE